MKLSRQQPSAIVLDFCLCDKKEQVRVYSVAGDGRFLMRARLARLATLLFLRVISPVVGKPLRR